MGEGTGPPEYRVHLTTFVAMPFQERFSYRSKDILEAVIGAAIKEAAE